MTVATFDEDCQITLTNTIIITNDITIDGTGVDVSVNGGVSNNFRLFYVKDGNTLTLTGVTLSGGRTNVGGAVYVEDRRNAEVDNCIFRECRLGANGFAERHGPEPFRNRRQRHQR